MGNSSDNLLATPILETAKAIEAGKLTFESRVSLFFAGMALKNRGGRFLLDRQIFRVHTRSASFPANEAIKKGNDQMAKVSKKKAVPLLAAALFCEKILEEKDSVTTLFRILDQLTVNLFKVAPPPSQSEITQRLSPPPLGPVARIGPPIFVFVAFKSGGAKGSYNLTIDEVTPSKVRNRIAESEIFFVEEDYQGINVRSELAAPFDPGVYWYEIRVDGRLMTRMPLKIVHALDMKDETKSVAKGIPVKPKGKR